MDNGPTEGDRTLLDRLNALKQSSVSFDQPVNQSSIYTSDASNSASDLHDVSSDLTARFKKLHTSKRHTTPAAPSAPHLPSGTDDPDDEKAVEELLAELGPEDQWTLNQDEETNINNLLAAAQRELPKPTHHAVVADEDTTGRHHPRDGSGEATNNSGNKWEIPVQGLALINNDEEAEEKNDEREADEVLQRVLDELQNEDNSPEEAEPPEPEAEPEAGKKQWRPEDHGRDMYYSNPPEESRCTETDSLNSLQATPSSNLLTRPLPTTSDPGNPQSSGELSLPSAPTSALKLPSTPTNSPAASKVIKGTKKEYDYTEEEVASWCIICNDDATMKCMGCEEDLYCARCWWETHGAIGERGHQWVKYERGK